MNKLLDIAPDLQLPLDVITLRVAIFGASGAGKTTFARLLAEAAHAAGQRFCAIDLKNDWYGLKSSADGSSPGIPIVVFGGPKRDIQLFDTAGALTAETVASIDQSVVIDLDDLSKTKQLKFLAAFMEKLYDANRRPILLLADESDRYAPQKPMSVEANVTLGASEDICRRGRKRGIGSTWLTQRTAVLNKNVSDLCDLTVVFRTPGAKDLDELEDRVGRITNKANRLEVLKMAPALEDGQAIFLSSHPKLRSYLPDPVRPVQLPMPWTYDSSATPSLGQARKEPKILAKTDIAAIEARMASCVQEAKAADPVELRKKNAELASQVKSLQQQLAQRPESKPQPVLQNGHLESAHELVSRLAVECEQASRLADNTKMMAERAALDRDKLAAIVTSLREIVTVGSRMPAAATAPRPATKPDQTYAEALWRQPACAPDTGMAKGEVVVLTACLQRPEGVASKQLTVLTSYARSTRDHYLQLLRRRGYIRTQGDTHVPTEAGRLALPSVGPLPTGAELRDMWLRELTAGELEIFKVLIDVYPEQIDKEELSQRTGYARSTRDRYLYLLGHRCLLDEAVPPGFAKLSDSLA